MQQADCNIKKKYHVICYLKMEKEKEIDDVGAK
jgi:hypothetical protein